VDLVVLDIMLTSSH